MQRQLRRDKAVWLETHCAEVQVHLENNNLHPAYKLVKKLCRGFKPKLRNIKDRDGKLLTNLQDFVRWWREYTADLYYNESVDSHHNLAEADPEILESEVHDAINRLPNRKLPGIDNIPAELIKAGRDSTVQFLTMLSNKIIETGSWPTD